MPCYFADEETLHFEERDRFKQTGFLSQNAVTIIIIIQIIIVPHIITVLTMKIMRKIIIMAAVIPGTAGMEDMKNDDVLGQRGNYGHSKPGPDFIHATMINGRDTTKLRTLQNAKNSFTSRCFKRRNIYLLRKQNFIKQIRTTEAEP